MTRREENKMLIEEVAKSIEELPRTVKSKEITTFQLSMIATMLGDISKSLAILADKVESENLSCEESTP